ncbi:MFS transporter [Secundilactobacillus collinoides]|uniref:Transporter, major facilitator family protein n=2 Tax=Secundilactobacillus collinoides TaxID=33960 RepID=A0A0R2BA73_SECCO|nr:MFS transporter [Secundilactobacillus collinoides]KRM73337.1 transporter, major facilitator family protein [Secundilactobacillus collinoides DSM 20515 = JCM 1123]
MLFIIYLAFVSLGLPVALLGAAWPSMYPVFGVPVSFSGIVFMLIAIGTIASSLASNHLTNRFGTGRVTAVSVLVSALALFGFGFSQSFLTLCIWAVPYGLGAGGVDASINNYVALHYQSRHMSWLHGTWGIGASFGPVIMGQILSVSHNWHLGYVAVAMIQVVFAAVLVATLALWPTAREQRDFGTAKRLNLDLSEIIKLPNAWPMMVTFFCYCTLEQTTNLWASSYLVLRQGLSTKTAASLAGLFFLGITIGRFVSGFLTYKLNDTHLIWVGQTLVAIGIGLMTLPLGEAMAVAGLLFIGLGCAPMYPALLHSVPAVFGTDRSQSVIGVQMAGAYVGTCVMPAGFGLIVAQFNVALLPVFLGIVLVIMVVAHKRVVITLRTNQKGVKYVNQTNCH